MGVDGEKRRVVVSGVGAVTPVGNTAREFWAAVCEGRSGIGPITNFDPKRLDVRIAGEVKGFDPLRFVDKKDVKKMDRFIHLALAAGVDAVEDAKVDFEHVDPTRAGCLVGSGIGGILSILEWHRVLLEKGPGRISPFFIPAVIVNMASGQLSMRYKLKGPNSAVVTACATGNHAIGDAFRLIQRGDADLMLAGGSEAMINELCVAGFCSMKALSARNDEPERASRPFDAGRDGFVCGEGAGVIVLESLDHARRRGARVYAEVVGYGMTADAHHMTAPDPDGDGATRAMTHALTDGGLAPESVGYINAHGTSTPYNDKTETLAIKRVFGEHARKLAISSTKSMIGHLLGAAGGVEAIVTVLALHHGILPPTINYEVPDPECDLDYVPNTARRAQVEVALSNGFGFGGTNATLAFRRFKE
ncbi:MAG: beta-ketoacyl-ACP synthase II [Candidatus Rokubacteria bacterium]|nr:beta-ketoacyl-ACP synthase II [Candidatus Rokubacteria bacterium]